MDAKLDALGERTDGVDARRRYDRNLSHREKDEAAQKAIAVAEVKAASLTIKEWRVAKEGYGATPIMSDGSPGAPLDLRELFSRYDAETAS